MSDLRGEFSWSLGWFGKHPIRGLGIILHLLLRLLFGIFFLAAGYNKIVKEWTSSELLRDIFLHRLTELHPDSFAAGFLQQFAIPFYLPLAWLITWGEIIIGLGLLLGIAVRWNAFAAFLMLLGFAMGGYYDASLLPFFALTIMFTAWPSGHWLGLDRRLYPRLHWFFR